MDRPEVTRLKEKGYRVRDKRVISLDRAMKKPSVRRELVLKSERTSGFQWPLEPQQVGSWVVLAINIVGQIVFLLDTFNEDKDVAIGTGILLVVTDIAVLALMIITTMSDPTDRTVQQERLCVLTKQRFDEDAYEFYCGRCEAHVLDNSKHCRMCNRCAAQFDHHCKWLNNCIGGANYRLFFVLIVIASIHGVECSSLALAQLIENTRRIDNKIPVAVQILYYFMAIVDGAGAIALIYLTSFHVWLWRVGLTTYQHIVLEREKKQAMEKTKLKTQDSLNLKGK